MSGGAVLSANRSGDDRRPALLVTADGTVFSGEAAGAEVPVATGELVFNTAMSGYQEVITDPSYAGQVIAFTSTHIGNYGTNADDDEARAPHCRGVVVCDLTDRAVELALDRGARALPAPPRRPRPDRRRHPAPGPPRPPGRGRALRLRHGARGRAARRRRGAAGTDGMDLVSGVTAPRSASTPGRTPARPAACASWPSTSGSRRPWSSCSPRWAPSIVVPAGTAADEVLALEPDGVFLSNGPGDPAALPGPIAAVADLVGPGAGLRHLPGPPAPGHGAGRLDLQAALRAPRGQPSGAAPGDRRGRDHQPEPQLRRGGRLGPRRRDDPRQPQRRRDRGLPLADRPGLLGAVPPRGGTGPPRRPLPLRRLPRADAGPPHADRPAPAAGVR